MWKKALQRPRRPPHRSTWPRAGAYGASCWPGWENRDAAGAELRRALALAEQLHSPVLVHPLAYDLGQWYESVGQERQAAALYGQAKAAIEHMATAVENDALRAILQQSTLVQAVYAQAVHLGD